MGEMLVKDAARIAAARTLKDYWDGSLPVDPVAIAESMGISVEFSRLKPGISGAIIVEDGDARILLDESENYGRQMFTCAHEIGHYVERMANGDHEYSFVERRTQKYDLHEFYADEFAGNLLMPASNFTSTWKKMKSDNLMAANFGVTPAAAKKRREKLALA
ncbi:ImmA/IrrE family metallo-endopeptidase [Arthrobacter alpinus]|nr:ImmA/IrrE family metallo-endopeptidase [Arthrobacter alpinus]